MNKHIGLGWYIFLILFTPLAACGLVYSVRTVAEYPKPLLWLGVGFVAYFLLQQYFKNRKMRRGDYTVDEFISTFSHEFTHTVVSWLMLKKVSSFKATSQHGGEIYHTSDGGVADTCIALAPYCLPIFTYAMLIVRSIVRTAALPYCDVLTGITIAFHVRCFVKQTRWDQPDINQFRTRIFPYWYILVALMFNLSVILLNFVPHNHILLAFRDLFVEYFRFFKSILGF